MRLIDAGTLFKRFQKVAMTLYGKDSERYQMVMDIMDGVRFAPTVDAVEVVRCKDCRNYAADCYCKVHDNYVMYDNDFCSYGKRKEVTHEET